MILLIYIQYTKFEVCSKRRTQRMQVSAIYHYENMILKITMKNQSNAENGENKEYESR